MDRRLALGALSTLPFLYSSLLSGCEMKNRKNIREFGKTFFYLKNPEARSKETGDSLLTIDGAEISGEEFKRLDWRNIIFRNCDFVGSYQIHLSTCTDVRWEDCRFAGIFGWGRADRIRFTRGAFSSSTIAYAGKQSTEVVFDSCQFFGTADDPNHWGGVGSDGEAEFIDCTGKWFNIDGHSKTTMRRCDWEDINCRPESDESGGAYADVLIEGSKLRGTFSMVPTTLQSLTIRDTTIDGMLDLSNATVKSDILMERVKGGMIQAGIKEGARSLTLRDSQILGDGSAVCSIYAGAFKNVLIENVVFGSAKGKPAGIGGGYDIDDKKVQPVLTQSFLAKNVSAPWWRSAGLNAAMVRIENCKFGRADFFEGRIEKFELIDTTFDSLDLRRTEVHEFKTEGSTDLKRLGRALNLEGSNIKLPN